VSEGKDVTLLVYGMLFEQALKAKSLLESQGLSVGLANMRSLKPVDEKYLLDVAKSSKTLVTIEDHFQTGGLYSILSEVLLANQTTAHVFPIALKEKWYKPGLLSEVLEYEGFTAEKLAARTLDHLGIAYDKASVLGKSLVMENEFDE
jgi:transketolase